MATTLKQGDRVQVKKNYSPGHNEPGGLGVVEETFLGPNKEVMVRVNFPGDARRANVLLSTVTIHDWEKETKERESSPLRGLHPLPPPPPP